MHFLSDLRQKAARERAWLVGDPIWMKQWLLDQAHRASSRSFEFKSGYAAHCRETLRYSRALDVKVGNLHWEKQPRVPAGNPDGGEWTRLAGDVPTPGLGHNQGPPLDELPQLPKERPPTGRERNRKAQELAKAGQRPGKAGVVLAIIRAVSWASREIAPIVTSYWDEPKSLEELKEAAKTPRPGYDRHHVAERASAKADNYPTSQIDGPDNIVSIPRIKHWQINRWYEKGKDEFGGLTPREYLKGKNWEEKTRVGLEALREHGVLK